MCLLGIDFGRFSDFPVLVLANREEFYARPSRGPRFLARDVANPAWIGGLDLVAGGTWLGLNEHGLLVAVTNRKKTDPPADPPSRGLLCRQLLAGREMASLADAALRELQGNRFAGCNLLIADREGACVIEAGDTLKMTRLSPGLHLLANTELNDTHDRRIERVRREFAHANPATPGEWFQAARQICPLTAAGDAPAICLAGVDRGTVSSTVLGIGRSLATSRYWFAPGPPNSTAYDDHAPLLRQLFAAPMPIGQAEPDDPGREANQSFRTANKPPPDIEPPSDSPARRAVRQGLTLEPGVLQVPEPAANSSYRILLRGPWQAEPLNQLDGQLEVQHAGRAEGQEGGPMINSSTTPLPAASTVRLPAAWQELFGTFRGCIRFRRKFHPPSNITAADRLAIVFDGVAGAGLVSLNGVPLGSIAPGAGTARFDVTGKLRTNNELQVDLEFSAPATSPAPGGLFAPVALEIQAANAAGS